MPDILRMSGEDVAKAQFEANQVNAKLKATKGKLPTELDKDSFLKLLVAELRHQDPTQPMNDREFISQMAQFSSLEQMSNINKSIEHLVMRSGSSEAFLLIGKEVEAVDPVSQKLVRGLVSGVVYRPDGVRIIVGSTEVSVNDIHAVYLPNNYRLEKDSATIKTETVLPQESSANKTAEQQNAANAYSINQTSSKGSSSNIQPLIN